jgi:uncharacterized secreted protein with C-terminal beta-propeller domain
VRDRLSEHGMNRRWLALAPLAVFACAPPGVLSSSPASPAPTASAPASAPSAPSTNAKPPVAAAATQAPALPMTSARLQPSSCAQHADVVKSRIAAMRAEMDARYKEWHDMQPECWAEDRRREAERLERERCLRTGNCGLGLMGIGEGGGGRGEGIGLGSIGTIGHGSGTGVGSAQITSKTNVQVAGVDEPDIVKTDGRYVYMVANGALRIVEALTAKPVSTTRVQGHANDMVVEGDRLVVFVSNGERAERCTYGYDCEIAGDGTSTTIHTYDIKDRAAPRKVRTIGLTGSLMTARRIGSTVHAVVADGDSAMEDVTTWPEDVEMCGTREDVLQKKFFALRAKNERSIRASTQLPTITDQGATKDLCMGLLENRFDKSHTFTTVVSFDMNDATAKATTSTIRSRPGTVYASNDALYVATHRRKNRSLMWYADQASTDEVTEIHKFRLGSAPADTRYLGSGVTQGHVLNTFAMDERAGDLRIATSRGKTPDPNVESQVDVLRQGPDGNLSRVGALLHLAKGEDLRAIRYDDDRAYLVTFKKTDPLFVIDLADAKQPKVLGELKIPGFSTYIHRLDKTHLLSIGFDANDHGDFAYFDGVLLQLFDVTNPTEPKLLHRKKLGARGSSSAATSDHHAFNYLPEKGLLAIPLTECAGGGDGVAGSSVSFAGLALFRVSYDKGFDFLGGVAHDKGRAHCGQWWSRSTTDVKRSVFVDDLVYSMATDRLKVQRMAALGKDVADLHLLP